MAIVGVAGPHPDLVPELCALAARRELEVAGVVPIRHFPDVPAVIAGLRAGGEAAIVARG